MIGLCASAQAATRQQQERTARKACLSGDYEKGVAVLSDLFIDTKDATYIFNQARCFEQNLRYQEAIGRFQEYLRAGEGLTASERTMAEKHIADCQELLAKQSPPTAAATPATEPAAPTPVTPPAAHPADAPAEPVAEASLSQPVSPSATTSGAGLRIAGVGVAAAGVAGLVTGLVLNLKANKIADDMKGYGAYSDSKESSRKSYETGGWIAYGAGAACMVAGGLLYFFGARSGQQASSRVALVPIVGPQTAGAALGGAF